VIDVTMPISPNAPEGGFEWHRVGDRLQLAFGVDELDRGDKVAEGLVAKPRTVADWRIAAAPCDLDHDHVERDGPGERAAIRSQAPPAELLVSGAGADLAERLGGAVFLYRADDLYALSPVSADSLAPAASTSRRRSVARRSRCRTVRGPWQ
jgi:hypothetical protein